MVAQSEVESTTGRKGKMLSNLWQWSQAFSINSLHNQVQQKMGKASESFRVVLSEILMNVVIVSLVILSMAVLAVSSLLCLALGWSTAAMVLGIVLLSVTIVARSSWTQKLDPMEREVLDVLVAAEVAYLFLIKQGFTVFNCFVVNYFVLMAFSLPYRMHYR